MPSGCSSLWTCTFSFLGRSAERNRPKSCWLQLGHVGSVGRLLPYTRVCPLSCSSTETEVVLPTTRAKSQRSTRRVPTSCTRGVDVDGLERIGKFYGGKERRNRLGREADMLWINQRRQEPHR